jgi:hypothetical protein
MISKYLSNISKVEGELRLKEIACDSGIFVVPSTEKQVRNGIYEN